MTRNENNSNVESLYSILENRKNGRLDSTFYGRFKRLRFKSLYLIVFTNNVPNISALSSDRFNLLVITDRMHSYTIVKCDVSLEIDNYSNSVVTWYSKARVSCDKDQENFYKKIGDMSEIDMSASVNEGAHLIDRQFDGDRRTRTYGLAPEPVQHLLNKFLSMSLGYPYLYRNELSLEKWLRLNRFNLFLFMTAFLLLAPELGGIEFAHGLGNTNYLGVKFVEIMAFFQDRLDHQIVNFKIRLMVVFRIIK